MVGTGRSFESAEETDPDEFQVKGEKDEAEPEHRPHLEGQAARCKGACPLVLVAKLRRRRKTLPVRNLLAGRFERTFLPGRRRNRDNQGCNRRVNRQQ